ncbi:MAG: protein phosphatase 2C domain-containing protein [Deltaproteobacteria bacterium]|nr:protein phosphatase 2C domain-containing protein [Deltaproteobacteria bacterium]
MTLYGASELHEAIGGSVAGREHRRLGRNNQDSFAITARRDRLVAVVTDGCSASPSSEVGARLGALAIAARLLDAPPLADTTASAIAADLGAALDTLHRGVVHLLGGAAERTISDLLLFGFIAARVERDALLILGLGDGLHQIGTSRTLLDPGPENAPAYPAYRLLPRCCLSRDVRLEVRVHAERLGSIERVVIGTDGAASLGSHLDEIAGDPRYARNPTLLQRRLNALVQRPGLIADDTTVISIRRKEEILPCAS